jgi:hypothetical protein
MYLGLAAQLKDPNASFEEHWAVKQVGKYPDVHLVNALDESVENIETMSGLVVDAARPNQAMQEHIIRMHRLGKPVLAFVSTQCPDSEIVGEFAEPQALPYPLAEWLRLSDTAPNAISVSRGLMRDLKLEVWLRAHLRLNTPGQWRLNDTEDIPE